MSAASARVSAARRVVQIVEPLDDRRAERGGTRAAAGECHHHQGMVGIDVEWRLRLVRLAGGERIVGRLDPAAAQQRQRGEKTGGPAFIVCFRRKEISACSPSTACTTCQSGA